jgi:hypothetical protein
MVFDYLFFGRCSCVAYLVIKVQLKYAIYQQNISNHVNVRSSELNEIYGDTVQYNETWDTSDQITVSFFIF